jgi:hypothetical protein
MGSPDPRAVALRKARQRAEAFVAQEGAGWTALYILAGVSAVLFLLVILNMSPGAF